MIASFVAFALSLPLPPVQPETVQGAIRKAIPQLVAGATGHADKKSCFACHNQAFPAVALSAARSRGLTVPDDFFDRQAEHITDFLAANKADFLSGKGTGGQAGTAAYALFTLELAGHKPDETTAAVARYILNFEPKRDHWRMTSNRPPTESSDFTATFTALRALKTYGSKDDRETIDKRRDQARAWIIKTRAKETEDRVFRLMGLQEAGAAEKEIAAAAWELVRTQRGDGGWSQLDGGAADPYATGSALYALHKAGGMKVDSAAYQAGVAFLLRTQLPDGTWKVKSRSKPFQPYYESGFPHEKDQFISISASSWATAALANCLK